MDIKLLLAFIPTFAAVLILPGPSSAFAVGQSLRYGALRSLPVALGFMLATGIHASLVLSGLGLLLARYAQAMLVLKWLGVAYLLYLAFTAFRARGGMIEVVPRDISGRRMLLSAMLVSLTNPKALLASLMIYPLFAGAEDYIAQSVALVTVAMLVSFSIYIGYILVAIRVGLYLRRSKWANKIVGSFYFGAAGLLASK